MCLVKTFQMWTMVVMTVVGLIVGVWPSEVLGSKAMFVSQYNNMRIQAKCPDGWVSSQLDEPSCYRYFHKELSFSAANNTCTQQDAHLAIATNPQELNYLLANIRETNNFWIGYQYISYGQKGNVSSWSAVHQPELMDSKDKALANLMEFRLSQLLLTEPAIQKNNTDFPKLCCTLKVKDQDIALSNCNEEMEFLCQKDVEYVCLDDKDNLYHVGEQIPTSNKCAYCTCGRSVACSTPLCGPPTCESYITDTSKCCGYTCIADAKTGLESNMQWMLTMAFSFFILGVVFIMIYRMRQKRMAYLRFRRERLQQLEQVEFEPGSGPPPPPDDFDGGFQGPPPPYSFYKEQRIDLPPPYEHLKITMPTVNANNRKTEHSGETVTLLGDSEPTTPSVQSADLTLDTTNRQNNQQTSQRENSPTSTSTNTTPTGSCASQESNSSTSTLYQTSV